MDETQTAMTMDIPSPDVQTALSGLEGAIVPKTTKLYTKTVYKTQIHAAKKLAGLLGTEGVAGSGWIYDYRGQTLCQGWYLYADHLLKAGLLAETETGGCVITEKGQEAIEAAPAKIEAHRIATLKEHLSDIAVRAQAAKAELERLGPCERSMDAVMNVEASGRIIGNLSDGIDWRC